MLSGIARVLKGLRPRLDHVHGYLGQSARPIVQAKQQLHTACAQRNVQHTGIGVPRFSCLFFEDLDKQAQRRA